MPRKTRKAAWPALPASVSSISGPIAVVRGFLPGDEAEDEQLLGIYDRARRQIRIASDLQGEPAWYTLHHELVHAWIDDAGEPWELDFEESVCRLIGKALTAEKARELGIA